MPYTDEQKRALYAQGKGHLVKNYKNGGLVSSNYVSFQNGGYVAYRNDGGQTNFVTVEGHTVVLDPPQVISPEGEDITTTPKGRNLLAKARAGYTEEQAAATKERQERNVAAVGALVSGMPRFMVEMLPGIGDTIAAYDTVDAFANEHYAAGTIMGVALIIGLVPGVGDAVAYPLKKLANKLPVADLQGIARALRDKDVEFLTGWMKTNEGKSVGARVGRPAGEIRMLIQNKDGSIDEFTGTMKDFRDQYGVGLSGSKKARGRTEDGRQWINPDKGGEFKEFKSGAAKLDEKPLDPATLEITEKGVVARLPRLNAELVSKLEDAVDFPLARQQEKFEKLHQHGEIENYENAVIIANKAWPEIYPEVQKLVEHLPVEKQNKVLQWARNRTKQVWGSVHEVNNKSGDTLYSVPTKIPSASQRAAHKRQTGKRWSEGSNAVTPQTLREAGVSQWSVNQSIRQAEELGMSFHEYMLLDPEERANLVAESFQKGLDAAATLGDKGEDVIDGVVYNWEKKSKRVGYGRRVRSVVAKFYDYPQEQVDVLKKYLRTDNSEEDIRSMNPRAFEKLWEVVSDPSYQKKFDSEKAARAAAKKAAEDRLAAKNQGMRRAVLKAFDISPEDVMKISADKGHTGNVQSDLETLYKVATGKYAPDSEIMQIPRLTKYKFKQKVDADPEAQRILDEDHAEALRKDKEGYVERYRKSHEYYMRVVKQAYPDLSDDYIEDLPIEQMDKLFDLATGWIPVEKAGRLPEPTKIVDPEQIIRDDLGIIYEQAQPKVMRDGGIV